MLFNFSKLCAYSEGRKQGIMGEVCSVKCLSFQCRWMKAWSDTFSHKTLVQVFIQTNNRIISLIYQQIVVCSKCRMFRIKPKLLVSVTLKCTDRWHIKRCIHSVEVMFYLKHLNIGISCVLMREIGPEYPIGLIEAHLQPDSSVTARSPLWPH